MKPRQFIFLIAFFVIISVFSPTGFFGSVKAEGSGSYSISCLKIEGTYKPSCIAEKPCLDYPADTAHPDPSHLEHEFKLSTSGLPANKSIYIVGCVQTDSNLACTAGNDTVDDKVRSLGFQIQKDPTHELAVLGGNPVQTLADGSVSAIARSYTPANTAHSFFAIYETPISETGGSGQSIQYDTFKFAQDISKCVSIHWDPEGRIFDSKSLEPIPDVAVKLLDQNKQLVLGVPGLISEMKTFLNGVFNFYAPSGVYHLQPSKSGYTFPLSINDVDVNYSKAYSCDKIVGYPLYTDQYPLNEQNIVIHCDVPLNPGKNTPYRSDPKTITYEQIALPGSTSVKYAGQISHPLTIVTLTGETTGKKVETVNADRYGFWATVIPNSNIPKKTNGLPDRLVAMYTKVDLTTGKPSTATKKGIIFEPIPRYIEGYAYNQNGVSLPFAQVAVVVDSSGLIESRTKTDEKGFFAVPSQNLPIFPYSLEIKSSTGSSPVIYTMSEFMEKNQDYLIRENVNLMEGTKGNDPVSLSSTNITPGGGFSSTSSGVGFTKYGGKNPSGITPSTTQEKKTNGIMMTTFLILSLLILGAGGGIAFYIRRKKIPGKPTQ